MTRVVLRRVLELAIVFLGVTFVIFAAVWALPGDPIRAMAGERPVSDAVIATIRAQYGLDDPLFVQYLNYLGGLVRGDLGIDFTGRSVAAQMADRWPVTIQLALTAWVMEIVLGLGLGIYTALRRGRWTSTLMLWTAVAISSVPVFVLAYLGQLTFGIRWQIFPIAGTGDGWPMGYLLPAFVIALLGMVAVSRLARGSILDNLMADHVRTARAKGLPESRVFTHHVLRNSLLPVLTFLAVDLGALLGGAVIVEGIFNIPGVGQLLFTGIQQHQGPLVVGVATALIVIFLLVNLLADLLSSALDPRIRHD
ncbi:binding-protein-dependent transport systems inner membrane component [Beutenbergia cavernae DSM 12333]|uniref:Binding-protein-dependent transport systems inner membrane component n=1 Tax=Beutenbergia cavernae (strain ATCC BAA-8 / DSM 12333 / CCUG 43141 / JCM 11478 / NBRC 16432 / NCIMB 13614 / HKI 0122) TaxID=471853 RepID=C5C3J2_BEUC1|nr:ABC transporter permease [Beutenbergia cavernae]ACQ81901.1 binding-protein-dependent transport systems inner membrane component [Beutenbergia cavernae DSM 12333]